MPEKPLSAGVLGIAGLGLAVVLGCYFGVFYQTGAQYYRACWERAHANGKQASSPDQAAAWSRCSVAADDALYDAGYIQAGNPEYAVTPQLKAIQSACPNAYSDVPLTGIWGLIVQMIQDKGGPDFVDRLFPARQVILNTVHSRWPNCPAARAANGFPKLVKRQEAWEWESPCVPCEAEQNAMTDRHREEQEAKQKWNNMSDAERQREIAEAIETARGDGGGTADPQKDKAKH